MTSTALESDDSERIAKFAEALEAVQLYGAISDTTIFLINFDLARLYNRLGETERAKAALAMARKGDHKVIEKRLALAPDLHAIGKPNLPEDEKRSA